MKDNTLIIHRFPCPSNRNGSHIVIIRAINDLYVYKVTDIKFFFIGSDIDDRIDFRRFAVTPADIEDPVVRYGADIDPGNSAQALL